MTLPTRRENGTFFWPKATTLTFSGLTIFYNKILDRTLMCSMRDNKVTLSVSTEILQFLFWNRSVQQITFFVA